MCVTRGSCHRGYRHAGMFWVVHYCAFSTSRKDVVSLFCAQILKSRLLFAGPLNMRINYFFLPNCTRLMSSLTWQWSCSRPLISSVWIDSSACVRGPCWRRSKWRTPLAYFTRQMSAAPRFVFLFFFFACRPFAVRLEEFFNYESRIFTHEMWSFLLFQFFACCASDRGRNQLSKGCGWFAEDLAIFFGSARKNRRTRCQLVGVESSRETHVFEHDWSREFYPSRKSLIGLNDAASTHRFSFFATSYSRSLNL